MMMNSAAGEKLSLSIKILFILDTKHVANLYFEVRERYNANLSTIWSIH